MTPRASPSGSSDEQVTHWNGVPAQLHDLVTTKQVDPARLASLHEVWSGGGDCPDALRMRFAEVYGLPIRATYGLTEAPTVVSIDPVGGERRPGASGRVLPHLWVSGAPRRRHAAAARRGGRALPVAAQPRASGPAGGRRTSACGATARVGRSAGGADCAPATIGVVDADGWLTVLDRLKVLIVRGGANVYPAEVERVLLAHDGVAGAAVFGVPDERLGERVAALVELQRCDVSMSTRCRGVQAQLADYKVPERMGVVDALPRNAMGKVVRTGLVDLLAAIASAS